MRVLFFLLFLLCVTTLARSYWERPSEWWASSAYDTLHDAWKYVKRAASDAYDSASSHRKKADGSKGISQSIYSFASGAATVGGRVAAAAGAVYESVGGFDGAGEKIVEASISLYEKAADTIGQANEAVRLKRETTGEKNNLVPDTVEWMRTVGRAAMDYFKGKNEGYNKDVRRNRVNAAAAGIKEAVGRFKQINKIGEPLYKHVSGGTWGMRQVNTIGQNIYKPSLLGSAFKGLGNVFWVWAAVTELSNIARASVKDKEHDNHENTIRVSSKAAGSWVGASYGAATGVAVFSVVPVVGTIGGAVLGGAVGAMSGSFVGEEAANVYIGHEAQN